jgi:outer membrane protein assembly factor BamB
VASYDDSRHDAEGDAASLNFAFPVGAQVRSDPTFDSTDQTVYFGSDDSPTNNFWAVRSNGELKWSFDAGSTDVQSKPALDTFLGWRFVYVNATNGNLFRIRAENGAQTGMTMNIGVSVGNTDFPSPVVDRNHQVYIGSTANNSLYAYENVDPFFWRLRWSRLLGEDVDAPPVADLTGGAYDGTIYVGRDRDFLGPIGGRVFSFAEDGTWNPNWGGTETDAFVTDFNVDTQPALSNEGSRIYVVDDSGVVYSIFAGTGLQEWRLSLNEPIDFVHPVVDTTGGVADGTIYVPTNGGRLYAITVSGTLRWAIDFGTGIYSSPIVGADGTIYIGTDGGMVHAINPDSTFKWQFSTGNGMHIRSSPDLGDDGTVYVGSDDGNLYALATTALPRNFRNNYVNFQQGYLTSDNLDANVVVDDANDWLNGAPPLTKGPWAVRTEIKRATSVNPDGNYEYTLLTWIRQCDQGDCGDIINTPFQDTTGEYAYSPGHAPDLPLEQVIELTPADHVRFERFLFGFTTAAGASDTQTVEIRDFELTFIQSGDPTIIDDPTWVP